MYCVAVSTGLRRGYVRPEMRIRAPYNGRYRYVRCRQCGQGICVYGALPGRAMVFTYLQMTEMLLL